MDDLAILILAAGRSSRMRGADKLLEDVDGHPLIRRQAHMAREVCRNVTIALPPAPHPRFKALEGLDVTRMSPAGSSEGMGGTLRDGIAMLHHHDAVMILPADMPDLTVSDLQILTKARADNPDKLIWRGTGETGQPGHPIIFAKQVLPYFSDLHGDQGARDIVSRFADQCLLVTLTGQHACTDLDTPEAWEAWRANR